MLNSSNVKRNEVLRHGSGIKYLLNMYGALDLIPSAIKKKKKRTERRREEEKERSLERREGKRERDLEDLRTNIVPQITLEFLPD